MSSTTSEARRSWVPPRAAASRAETMPKSAIREIMALAAGMDEVIHLEVGEPDFDTDRAVIEAGCEALRAGWTRYTANAGIPSLREAIARKASIRARPPISPEQVVVTTGAVGALHTAVMSVVDSGDEILIPDPGWPNYESIAHMAGAVPVRYPLHAEDRFVPDVTEVARCVTNRTKAIIVNSPANPTGAVFPRAVVAELLDLAERTGIYVVSDEIYEDIVFEGEHVSAVEFGLADRTFLVSGVSKSYAMTGWRLGYLVAPPVLADVCARLQEPVTSCAPAVSQRAAEAAIRGSQDSVVSAVAVFRSRRELVIDVLEEAGLLLSRPAGAFYALVALGDRYVDSVAFAKDLLAQHHVATVPGVTFGSKCSHAVRISFTTRDDRLLEGLRRLRTFAIA